MLTPGSLIIPFENLVPPRNKDPNSNKGNNHHPQRNTPYPCSFTNSRDLLVIRKQYDPSPDLPKGRDTCIAPAVVEEPRELYERIRDNEDRIGRCEGLAENAEWNCDEAKVRAGTSMGFELERVAMGEIGGGC